MAAISPTASAGACNHSPAPSKQDRYKEALKIFKYRLDQSLRGDHDYIIGQMEKVFDGRALDPDKNLLDIEKLTINKSLGESIKEINEKAKSYLELSSCDDALIEEQRAKIEQIKEDFRSILKDYEEKGEEKTLTEPFAFTREASFRFDPSIPPEESCPLIRTKLQNPHQELTIDDSIDLLTTCIRYGQEHTTKIQDKEAIIVIGNTGAGKSTMVNYFAGCMMELKSPEDLGFEGIDDFVVVKPAEEGGTFDEIMPIGHTKESKTFMPQIETAPGQRLTYCDCPGFLDNRGAEINIANAVNVKNAIIKAKSVKIIILINYHSLKADRGRGLSDMLKICSNLFGQEKNLESCKDSLLLGVTQVPLSLRLPSLKKWIVKDTPDIMTTLVERLFIFDPLDRPLEGGWNRQECLSQLHALTPIANPSRIFRTVLTDSDEKKLVTISEKMGENIHAFLKQKNFPKAASSLRQLQRLSLIEHISIERLLHQNTSYIERYFQERIDEFKAHCHFEHFSEAEAVLREIQEALVSLDSFKEFVNLDKQSSYYQESETRYEVRIEKERVAQENLQRAQGQIAELLKLLEEQKQETERQLQVQEQKRQEMIEEMQKSIKSSQLSYEQTQKELRQEMETLLAKKDEEFAVAMGLNQEETQRRIAKEKEQLVAKYEKDLQASSKENAEFKKQQIEQQKAYKEQAAAKNAEMARKIKEIEAQQAQKAAELQKMLLQKIPFGAAEWEKYFGAVGEEPPLPKDIVQILKSTCPFFPGKTVEETHLLTLIPQTVNGKPLTLDTLEELIKSPQKGGHATQYRNYSEYVKKELGAKSFASHWVLMTRDVIPDSRNKSYDEQKALVRRHAEQSGISYELPTALKAATAILMHHVRSGERLYSDSPYTYTRCIEKVDRDKWPLAIGGFASGGLAVIHGLADHVHSGVGCLRKL